MNDLSGNFHWQSRGYIDNVQYTYQFRFIEDNKILFSCVMQPNDDTLIQTSIKGTSYLENDILLINITHESLPYEKGQFYFRYETLSENKIVKMEIKTIKERNEINDKLIVRQTYGENIFGIFHNNSSIEFDKIIHWIH